MEKHNTYANIKITKLPHAEVEITGEISKDEMEKNYKRALANIAKEATLPGFRKGHVPEDIIVNKFGEMYVLEEAAEISLGEVYPHIVTENNIAVIGRPEITITKIAKGSPLEFKIKVPIFPEVTLADYKSIAKEEMKKTETAEVSPEEVEAVVKQLQENAAMKNRKTDEESNDEKPKELPPVDEAFIKSFGDWKSVEEFKDKIKENLKEEKIIRLKEKKRLAIGDKLVLGSMIDLLEVLVQGELQKMRAQFEEDLKRMGLKMDDYLKHANKKNEDLETEWRVPAEGRAKLQIILNKIALEEKIEVPHDEVHKERDHILEHHKDADSERVESYVEMMLMNEKIFQFLESQK